MIMKIKCHWYKELIFILFALVGFYVKGNAIMNPAKLPNVNQHVSQGVYTSTTSSVAGTFYISTYSAILHSVAISSYGSANATFQFYDASSNTSGQPTITSVFNAGTINPIDNPPVFNIATSSGLALVNSGTTPAQLTITFRVR